MQEEYNRRGQREVCCGQTGCCELLEVRGPEEICKKPAVFHETKKKVECRSWGVGIKLRFEAMFCEVPVYLYVSVWGTRNWSPVVYLFWWTEGSLSLGPFHSSHKILNGYNVYKYWDWWNFLKKRVSISGCIWREISESSLELVTADLSILKLTSQEMQDL